jgi:guanylate kinase
VTGAAKGLLFVVTAPSGAGKSTLIAEAVKGDPRLRVSVSHTTRAPRPGEKDGREYHFVDEAAFLAMLGRAEFLESAQVHGHRYGTSHRALAEAVAGGHDVVLEIDWQGAQQVRKLHPQAIGIFILPPSLAELERRMRARGQDSEPVIRRRMENAREEMAHAPEFDYAIINNDFEAAREDLAAIIRAARLAMARQLERHPELFQPKA